MHKDFEPTTFDTDPPGQAGALPALARWLQRLGLRRPGAGRDPQTGLLHRQGLLDRGEQRLATARWRNGGALALFEVRDLLEVRGIYGDRAGEVLLARLVRALARLAGRHGLAARTGPAQFAVLLPGHDRDAAVRAMHRAFGRPCRIEHDLHGEELVLVPDVAVETCQPGELAALYAQLVVTIGRQRHHEERRQVHLRRERERHSRPAPLEPAGVAP